MECVGSNPLPRRRRALARRAGKSFDALPDAIEDPPPHGKKGKI